jgi:hypothetical protein
LKKRHKISHKALLLLLVYLFSNTPSILFHHHTLEIAYENATSCEKAIYYSEKDGNCSHKTHISKASEKCGLCDDHTVSPHSSQTFSTKYFSREFSGRYLQVSENYYFQTPSTFCNRGPPSVSFRTV